MAFRKDRTTAAQTAANVAGNVTAALIAQGSVGSLQEAANAVDGLFGVLFARLGPVVDSDNEVFAAAEASEGASSSRTRSSNRYAKTGGGEDGPAPTLESALSMKMKGGAFEGKALADILNISAQEADEDHAYGDGKRGGREYIAWLASPRNKNKHTRDRALLVAEAENIEPLEAFAS